MKKDEYCAIMNREFVSCRFLCVDTSIENKIFQFKKIDLSEVRRCFVVCDRCYLLI